MKKRILTALLAVVMVFTTQVIPAGAAETVRFSDLPDTNTATAVESLRLMGVLDGYGDGTFRPDRQLTRAQFCKMVTYMVDGAGELGRYRAVTVFPDVKPSHWAAGYINLAAKGRNIIAGYPDGKFYPERTVTLGQAVTILLRLLGYKDEDVGGVWPDSYMAVGAAAGLTDGVGTDGNAPLTRAQAAKLFVNLLRFTIQGMGYSNLAVTAGVLEMVARGVFGVCLVPWLGFAAVCFASPAAWVMADLFLFPAYCSCMKKRGYQFEKAQIFHLSKVKA